MVKSMSNEKKKLAEFDIYFDMENVTKEDDAYRLGIVISDILRIEPASWDTEIVQIWIDGGSLVINRELFIELFFEYEKEYDKQTGKQAIDKIRTMCNNLLNGRKYDLSIEALNNIERILNEAEKNKQKIGDESRGSNYRGITVKK